MPNPRIARIGTTRTKKVLTFLINYGTIDKSEETVSINLIIQHDLSKLSVEQLAQYLRAVSEFIGLDPDLNALDTIWMQNENGPGQSLVVYARRGTAEILRNKLGIEVSFLTQAITPQGSIVYTATGKNKQGRQEIAVGSKFVSGLTGKALDDAIMTASTRALRRLTMQFTSLGILDESEVGAIKGTTENPAAGATLVGSSVVLPPMPSVPANSAPGRDVTPVVSTVGEQFIGQKSLINAAMAQVKAKQESEKTSAKPDIKADIPAPEAPVTPAVAPVTSTLQPDTTAAKPKRAYRKRNVVSLDGPESEVVSNPIPAPVVAPASAPTPTTVLVATVAPVQPPLGAAGIPAIQVASAPPPPPHSVDFPGKPSEAQMGEYRKRVSVYTLELPASENMGSVQKMRAFITRMSGFAPQFMTADQWEEMLGWFESFVGRNQVKGLVKYINDSLGVK